jgi:hypothetical protein
MSVENHPNINAAGFATSIHEEFFKHLRGPANETPDTVRKASTVLHEELMEFVIAISSRLDEMFGTG